MRTAIVSGIVLMLLGVAGPAVAGEEAGTDTVSKWRDLVGRSEDAMTFYAYGAMAANNLWISCKNPRSVAELTSYLRYRATPVLSMKQAMVIFFAEGDCAPLSSSQFRENLGLGATK